MVNCVKIGFNKVEEVVEDTFYDGLLTFSKYELNKERIILIMKIIEYEDKYLDDVKDLLVELEEYIISIDKDNLDLIHLEYRDKMAVLDLEKINNNNGKCYLAVENDEVVGLIMGYVRTYDECDYLDYKCPRSGEVSELIVSKNVRSKSIGKQLMLQLEEHFKKIGCEYIFIDVFAYNKNAIKFYEKLGFHTRGLIDVKKLNIESNYKCVIATEELLNKKWNIEIKKHDNSDVWKKFKIESLRNIDNRIVYMGILNDEIITESTAIISENDIDMQNKVGLIGEGKAYLTAFRTNKEFENQGYFSKLYSFMEEDLKKRGFKSLTLGVEPCETRNIQIYFKWGFTKYIKTDYEYYSNGEKILVNYYEKELINEKYGNY